MSAFNKYLKYLQIPYHHLGRDFSSCDCLGIVRLFYAHELGIQLPDLEFYEVDWYRQGKDYFLEKYAEFGFRPVADPQYGDTILFSSGRRVTHCGVIVDVRQGYFLHMTKTGPAIHGFKSGDWSLRLSGYYRHKGFFDDYQGQGQSDTEDKLSRYPGGKGENCR